MSYKVFLDWEQVNTTWDNLDQVWEDVSIIIEVAESIKRRGGSLTSYVEGNPWGKLTKDIGQEKTKKFIKIFCKVNELDYEEVMEKKKDIKITVDQFEKTFNESLKLGVKVDFIK